jgi:hypothetical protein
MLRDTCTYYDTAMWAIPAFVPMLIDLSGIVFWGAFWDVVGRVP